MAEDAPTRNAPRRFSLPALPRWGWAAAAVLVAVLVAALVAVALSGGRSVAATMRAAGCTYRDAVPYPPKDEATRADYHADVPTLTSPVRWKTFPPSGGSHYRLWATWAFYRGPVNPRMAVHNEEHGGVVIWWGPKVPASTIAQLKRFYDSSPVGMLGTPLAGLGDKVALTAWTADPSWKGDPAFAYKNHHYGTGHVAVCPRFDQKAFAAFRNAYRGKSPQGFPLSADRPGCGPTTVC